MTCMISVIDPIELKLIRDLNPVKMILRAMIKSSKCIICPL